MRLKGVVLALCATALVTACGSKGVSPTVSDSSDPPSSSSQPETPPPTAPASEDTPADEAEQTTIDRTLRLTSPSGYTYEISASFTPGSVATKIIDAPPGFTAATTTVDIDSAEVTNTTSGRAMPASEWGYEGIAIAPLFRSKSLLCSDGITVEPIPAGYCISNLKVPTDPAGTVNYQQVLPIGPSLADAQANTSLGTDPVALTAAGAFENSQRTYTFTEYEIGVEIPDGAAAIRAATSAFAAAKWCLVTLHPTAAAGFGENTEISHISCS